MVRLSMHTAALLQSDLGLWNIGIRFFCAGIAANLVNWYIQYIYIYIYIFYLKASPLPPAPLVISYLVTGRIGRTGRTGRTGRVLERVILGTQTCYLGRLEAPFWDPGTPFW